MTLERHLAHLTSAGLVRLGQSEPELEYLFRHALIQEATYASLLKADRQMLHKAIAETLLTLYPDQVKDLAPVLAHHYHFAYDVEGERHYTRLAADHFAMRYANAEALDYYARLLALLAEANDQSDVHLKMGAVLELMGRWDEAEAHYRDALVRAVGDAARTGHCQFALGKLGRLRGNYSVALDWLFHACTTWETLEDPAGLGQVFIEMGYVFWCQGEYTAARQYTEKSLTQIRKSGNRTGLWRALHSLGNIAHSEGDYTSARAFYEESLLLAREIGDKKAMAISLNNLGFVVAQNQSDYVAGWALLEESLALRREMGDKWGITQALNNLGVTACMQGDYAAAQAFIEESLGLERGLGDKWSIAITLENAGIVALERGDYATSQARYMESLQLAHEIGSKLYVVYGLIGLAGAVIQVGSSSIIKAEYARYSLRLAAAAEALLTMMNGTLESLEHRLYDRTIAAGRAVLREEAFNAAWAEGQALTMEEAIALALRSNSA